MGDGPDLVVLAPLRARRVIRPRRCREAIEAASTLIEPVKNDLSAAERASIVGRLTEAGKLCDNDKYTDSFVLAAKVVRFAGHVEARKGVIPVL